VLDDAVRALGATISATRIEQGVCAEQSEKDPKSTEQGNPGRSAAQGKA
jgi:hypothetical protein